MKKIKYLLALCLILAAASLSKNLTAQSAYDQMSNRLFHTTLHKAKNSIQVIAITPSREQDSTAEYILCTRSNAL